MMVPTLVVVVRTILLVMFCSPAEVQWMLVDLGRDLRRMRIRSGEGIKPEDKGNRVEQQLLRQAFSDYPRLQ